MAGLREVSTAVAGLYPRMLWLLRLIRGVLAPPPVPSPPECQGCGRRPPETVYRRRWLCAECAEWELADDLHW